MALQGYEVSEVRYLAKPLDENRLREALLFCYEKVLANNELLLPVTNLRYVQEFRKSAMELTGGRLVPVSKKRILAYDLKPISMIGGGSFFAAKVCR